MQQTTNQPAKIPSRVWIILLSAIVLSLIAIGLATYIIEAYPEVSTYLLILGAIGIIFSLYTLIQVRRRIFRMRIESPPITTTIECKKCGYKNVREFQRGDFIFKEVDHCEKCNDKMLITAIFREVKEKDKEVYAY